MLWNGSPYEEKTCLVDLKYLFPTSLTLCKAWMLLKLILFSFGKAFHAKQQQQIRKKHY